MVQPSRTVLFICTGNTCRSPLAAGYFNRRRADTMLHWRAASAGMGAPDGAPATEEAQLAAEEAGFDLGDHRARTVDERIIAGADLVLALTPHHQDALFRLFPREREKILTLHAAAGEPGGEIADPYGQSVAVYRRTLATIAVLVDRLQEKMKEGTW